MSAFEEHRPPIAALICLTCEQEYEQDAATGNWFKPLLTNGFSHMALAEAYGARFDEEHGTTKAFRFWQQHTHTNECATVQRRTFAIETR